VALLHVRAKRNTRGASNGRQENLALQTDPVFAVLVVGKTIAGARLDVSVYDIGVSFRAGDPVPFAGQTFVPIPVRKESLCTCDDAVLQFSCFQSSRIREQRFHIDYPFGKRAGQFPERRIPSNEK
jgi:hypothetical protein